MNFNFVSSSTSPRQEIESLFQKIFSPIKKELDPNLVGQFCQKLNSDLDGAQLALDMLTPKIQSSQEWESLIALYTLEACVKNCGERFHDLVGRFRFLNELIKLVSPKYYGNRTPEKVKQRCIELLYSWSLYLNRPKIKEAYEMLKKQGIITHDPTHVDKLEIKVPPRMKNPIFEDEEKSRKLQRLLKSKNPQDLEEANRIIKNMVRQDEMKTEKISNRINELEHINNNIRLLNDMLLNYNSATATESEKETIKYLYDELEKLRPNLVNLASETDDNDEAIADIIKANEQSEKIIGQYKLIFLKSSSHIASDDKLVNLMAKDDDLLSGFETVKPSNQNFDPLRELQDLFATQNTAPEIRHEVKKTNFDDLLMPDTNSITNNIQNLFSSINLNSNQQNYVMPKNQPQGLPSIKTPQLKALDDLNQLGKDLMQKSLTDPKTPLNAALNPPKSSNTNEIEVFNVLNGLFIDLESIKPNTQIGPVELYSKNSVKIVLHFASNAPNEYINVCVLSVTSLNTNNNLKNFTFQAAVPKPASRSDLPVYNPILPPTAITQIMLIANPNKEQIRLKYKVNYHFDDVQFNEPDDVKTLPNLY